MKTECIVYTFRADNKPHGIIQVARVTENDGTNPRYPNDLMIDFPQRYLEEHPHCQELMGMAAVEFVDDRNSSAPVDCSYAPDEEVARRYAQAITKKVQEFKL